MRIGSKNYYASAVDVHLSNGRIERVTFVDGVAECSSEAAAILLRVARSADEYRSLPEPPQPPGLPELLRTAEPSENAPAEAPKQKKPRKSKGRSKAVKADTVEAEADEGKQDGGE